MTTPWKTDKYFVSPLNYLPEVTKDYHLPAKIKIHDITLRDGEQETGIALQKDDKVAIAEALAEAGVHRIEAGMPAVSKQDENAIREIVKRNLGPEIFAFCRCILDDVRLAADCGVSGVIVEIPSSEHIIEYGYQWPLCEGHPGFSGRHPAGPRAGPLYGILHDRCHPGRLQLRCSRSSKP